MEYDPEKAAIPITNSENSSTYRLLPGWSHVFIRLPTPPQFIIMHMSDDAPSSAVQAIDRRKHLADSFLLPAQTLVGMLPTGTECTTERRERERKEVGGADRGRY